MPGSSLTPTVPTISSPFTFSVSPSSVNASSDTITFGVSHNLVTGNEIWFYPFTVNSAAAVSTFGGISPYIKYFAIVVSSFAIKLATTLANALSGIALDLTTPTTTENMLFSKAGPFAGIGQSSNAGYALPESYPAYATPAVTFNSSTQVEITFSVPAWNTLATTNPIQVLLRQKNTSNYYGITVHGGVSGVYSFDGVTLRSYVGLGTYLSAVSIFPTNTPNVTGYTQKYVINSSRQIDCWIGQLNGTLTKLFTTSAFSPNVELQLEFGSISSIARLTDCNIKYL